MTFLRYSKIWQDPSARRYLGNLARTADIRRLLKLGFLAFEGKKKKTPDGLEKSLEAVLRRSITSSNGCRWPILPVLPLFHKGNPWTAIDLATKSWECRPKTIDWSTHFADGEDSMALHRFGWILRGIERDHRVPWAVIAAWLDWINRSQKDSRPEWVMDSYTVSERICNFSTLLMLDPPQDKNLISRIRSRILEEALFLTGHLEYYGHNGTNNHILNNARALIFAGTLLENNGLFDCGLELLRHQLSYHCSPGGVFREASSHYQWVITRWMVEIALVLDGKKTPELEGFLPQVQEMLNACDKLSLGNGSHRYIPRIGDVSPDFPPEWYLGMTETARALLDGSGQKARDRKSGWAGLFGVLPENQNAPAGSWISDRGDWLRFESGSWSLMAHADREVEDPRARHGHQDLFSFELAYRGIPIVIDKGRRDYVSGPTSEAAGLLDEWHNSLLVDDRRFGFTPRGFMDPEWLRRHLAIPQFRLEKNRAVLSLNQPPGFHSVASVERIWETEDRKMIVRTRIQGTGQHTVRQFLYTPSVSCSITGENCTFHREEPLEWYPSYGKTAACRRLEWRDTIDLPWEGLLVLSTP